MHKTEIVHHASGKFFVRNLYKFAKFALKKSQKEGREGPPICIVHYAFCIEEIVH